MTGVDCACIAKLVSETIELRTSVKGVLWAGFSAVVGSGDDSTFLRVSVFGDVARKLAGNITRGDKLYLEGQLTLSRYLKDGEERVNLQVAASKCEQLPIGRSKPPRKPKTPRQDDERPANGHADPTMRDWQRPPAGEVEIPF